MQIYWVDQGHILARQTLNVHTWFKRISQTKFKNFKVWQTFCHISHLLFTAIFRNGNTQLCCGDFFPTVKYTERIKNTHLYNRNSFRAIWSVILNIDNCEILRYFLVMKCPGNSILDDLNQHIYLLFPIPGILIQGCQGSDSRVHHLRECLHYMCGFMTSIGPAASRVWTSWLAYTCHSGENVQLGIWSSDMNKKYLLVINISLANTAC